MLNIINFTLKGRIIPNLYGLIHLRMYRAYKFIFKKNCAVHNFDSPRSQQKYMLDIQLSFKEISSTVTDLPMNN